MDRVTYGIYHQAVANCPKCGEMDVTDLGEFDDADGVEITCANCGQEFELNNEDN